MKKCKNCENQIQDQYTLCVECNAKISEKNALQEIATHLKHINWNMGTIVAILKNDTELENKIRDAQNGKNNQ